MSRLKNSLIAFAGLLALIGAVSLLTPQTGHGQTEVVGPTKPVLVVNSPSEPVPVTGTVSVSNLGGSPLPVRDVDNGQQPFHRTVPVFYPSGSGGVTTVFTVPAGKRLIIETVSARAELAPIDTPNIVEVLTTLGSNNTAFHEILVSKQGLNLNGLSVFVGTHDMRAYADPGTDVQFQFQRSDSLTPLPHQ